MTYYLLINLKLEKNFQLSASNYQLFFVPLHPISKYGQVLHGQLPRNPPGRERSKGTWL